MARTANPSFRGFESHPGLNKDLICSCYFRYSGSMRLDPRGGHNRKEVNKDFFKKWSADMSYVLGYIAADGAIVDVRKTSRTCYLSILSTDLEILLKFKKVMKSSHEIYIRESSYQRIKEKVYKCSKAYILRIGSKEIVQDLINLGLTPRKSLRLRMPKIPTEFLNHFIRGYFDGDGCINLYVNKKNKNVIMKMILVCGTRSFLNIINYQLSKILNIELREIVFSSGVYRLTYHGRSAMKFFDFIYKDISNKLYLDRKYQKYLSII